MQKDHAGLQPIVQLTGVSKTYRLGQTVVEALRTVDLTLARREFTAIIGPSGSGKSTLLSIIGCIDTPDRGRVLIDNIDTSRLSDNALSDLRNEKIGFIFQSFNLVPVLTVYENIELPLLINDTIARAEHHARIMTALRDVGMETYSTNLPDQLSGGQRQRVAIARALVQSPTLVLADEPTANLDSVNTHKIIDLMLDLNQKIGTSFLFSTHDEKLIDRVSRVIRIQDGSIST
ncbi:MAG: ABC transporter ATP-binding protein [Proteobacteria bacterium]|nr:ABC transporter ATP-binding protein [Pseudomonadota bacterium]